MIRSFIFSEGKLVGQDLELEALRLVHADKGLMLWVDLESPTEQEVKQILEGVFQFHPLAIEDCVTPSSLPKVEDYESYLFIVAHGVDFKRSETFDTTELDLFLGKEFLVTFHNKHLVSVQTVMERAMKATGVVARGPDRLAHLLLDAMVDNYKPAVDELRNELEELEEAVLGAEVPNLSVRLLELRSEVGHLRQIIRPQRDMISRLARGESKLLRTLMLPYFRDLRDNLIRIEETAASFTDQLLVTFDLYLSKSAFEANAGIKALTALTAISLPATVIGSWYGMNFEGMPELKWKFGYFAVLLITVVLTLLTWRYCRRRGWI